MSTNKSIFYLICNKGIIVNLYKPHFLSSHFYFFQPNKRVFYPPTFSPLQPNTHKGKLNIFYPSTNFLSSYFFTPPTKQTLSKRSIIPCRHGNEAIVDGSDVSSGRVKRNEAILCSQVLEEKITTMFSRYRNQLQNFSFSSIKQL